jgi:hypothetical protein
MWPRPLSLPVSTPTRVWAGHTVAAGCRLQLKCDGTRWRTGGEKWRGNWRMEWVASTLHTTSQHGVSSITTADAHNSAASSRLNWRTPADLNGLVRFAERLNLVSARVPSHFKRGLRTAWYCSRFHQIGTRYMNYALWWQWEMSSRKWHSDHW